MINQEKTTPVEIFTDGSCEPNPGPGGWAAIIVENGERTDITGYSQNSTNNRMELTAAIEALKKIERNRPVKIYTDSQYLQKGVTEWLDGWKARNWKRKGGKLANTDLWKALSDEIEKRKIAWYWIRGHAGHPENEIVDRMAKQILIRKNKKEQAKACPS